MDAVTVIIPVYNVENYLRRCVDSILVQTCLDIEIILVDDGSPDGSAFLCDNYLSENNITVIHKGNGGLGSSRNVGIRLSGGQYVLFVDSDDWIDSPMIYDLINIEEREKTDFVRTRGKYANWTNHFDGEVCDFGIETMMHTGRYDRRKIEKEILPIFIATPQITFGPIVSAWGTLYRRDFLVKNRIFFFEDVKYSEDCIFNARVLMECESFYYLNSPQYYNYFYNNTSITKSYRADRWESNKRLIKRFEEVFGADSRFDIPKQLWRKRIFCILNALNEKHNLATYGRKVQYCKNICNDQLTMEAMKHLDDIDISWRLKIYIWMIKHRLTYILAIIG